MGFFDFLKGAGKEPPKPEPVQRETAMSAAEKQAVNDRRIAMGIAKHIESLGLEVQDFSVKVNGDTATVNGTVEDLSLIHI